MKRVLSSGAGLLLIALAFLAFNIVSLIVAWLAATAVAVDLKKAE